jgi:hypothetical protein
MPPRLVRELGAILIGLSFSLLLISPTSAESCPPAGPNCICRFGWCIRQLRLNVPQYVHLQVTVSPAVAGRGNPREQILQNGVQQEIPSGSVFYIQRSKTGSTKLTIQYCEQSLNPVGGSTCTDWFNFVLPEPSGQQLEFCRDYADKAAAAEKENVKSNCGYTGPRWTTDPKENYNACAGSPDAAIWPNETAARANDLQTCGKQKATPLPDTTAIDEKQSYCKGRCACCASGNCGDTSICISKSATVDPNGYYGCFKTCTSRPIGGF